GFGERIVVRVSDAADRGFDAGLGQAFGIADTDVLGGFKRSSQHRYSLMPAIGQALRLESSSPTTSEVSRSASLQRPRSFRRYARSGPCPSENTDAVARWCSRWCHAAMGFADRRSKLAHPH